MKDIEILKKEYLKKLSQKYYKESPQNISGDSLYRCSILAEMFAYMKSILPNNVSKYTIFDFDGKSECGEILIPDDIAVNAKNVISTYCWNKTWSQIFEHFSGNLSKIRRYLNNSSFMMNRLKNGNNILIFGESVGSPIGRTMVASIIMKEAIKLRAISGQRGQNYEWIDFSALKNAIIRESDDVLDYKSCSWLVVDNIFKPEYSSIQQREYLSEIIDSFFIDRLNSKLPTIFVFKFDIRNDFFNAEEEMGTGISKIINNKETYNIPLCKEFKV